MARGRRRDRPAELPLRDLADFAIDHVRADRAGRSRGCWLMPRPTRCATAPIPTSRSTAASSRCGSRCSPAAEARHGVKLERVSGVLHRPQPAATLARLRAVLEARDDFTLAALTTLAPLAASLTVALAALEPDADTASLFAAANAEEDWQAELWGWEQTAEERRARRLADFENAAAFARLAQAD